MLVLGRVVVKGYMDYLPEGEAVTKSHWER
jgi:hypothetical protein